MAEEDWFDRVEVFKDARNTDSEHVHLIDEAEQVLGELGFSAQRIEALRRAKVIL